MRFQIWWDKKTRVAESVYKLTSFIEQLQDFGYVIEKILPLEDEDE